MSRKPLAGTKHLFLVEGQPEEGVVRAILRRDGHDKSATQIRCLKGVTNLKSVLRTLVSEPEWHELGSVTVVVDADDDPEARSTSVWNALGTECRLPDAEVDRGKKDGYVVSGSIRYAVWLSPGDGSHGTIEDMVVATIEHDVRDRIMAFWKQGQKDPNEAEPTAKAIVAIWLALKTNKGIGLRTAFERALIDLDHPAFEPLRELIRTQLGHRRS
jgi:hypothetical protein